jgi:hypothetical protein
MPLTLNSPETIVIDTVKITQFVVTPESGLVTIHYSLGFIDGSGNFVSKEHDKVDLANVEFEQPLYEAVKNKLYSLLNDKINSPNIESIID